jgi:hypothetical protein
MATSFSTCDRCKIKGPVSVRPGTVRSGAANTGYGADPNKPPPPTKLPARVLEDANTATAQTSKWPVNS